MTNFIGEEISVGKRYVYLKNERTGSSTVRKLKMVGVCVDAHKLKFQRHFSEVTYRDKRCYSADETRPQIDRVNKDDVICEWAPLSGAYVKKKITVGDRIRAMSDEEYVDVVLCITRLYWNEDNFDLSNKWCDLNGACVGTNGEDIECTEDKMRECILRWLHSKGDKNERYHDIFRESNPLQIL